MIIETHDDGKLRRQLTIWYIFNLEIAERCRLESSNAGWQWLAAGYVAILATYFLVYNVSDTLTYWRLLGTDPVSSLGSRGNINLDGTVLTPAAAARGTRPHHHRTRLLLAEQAYSDNPRSPRIHSFHDYYQPIYRHTHTNSQSFSKFVVRI